MSVRTFEEQKRPRVRETRDEIFYVLTYFVFACLFSFLYFIHAPLSFSWLKITSLKQSANIMLLFEDF